MVARFGFYVANFEFQPWIDTPTDGKPLKTLVKEEEEEEEEGKEKENK